jgi:hypothetical protein
MANSYEPIAISFGRFTLRVHFSNSLRPPHSFTVDGRAVPSGHGTYLDRHEPIEALFAAVRELQAESDNLDVQDEIAADPEKYARLAEEAVAKKERAEADAKKRAEWEARGQCVHLPRRVLGRPTPPAAVDAR